MIPPNYHSVPTYPGTDFATTVKAIIGDAAAHSLCDGRTIEDLRRGLSEIEERIRSSAGTDRQLRSLSKEKKKILQAIEDKEIAEGFTNGSLIPFVDRKQGLQTITFVPRSDRRRYIRKVATMVFRRNADVVRAKSEDKKTVNLSGGRGLL